MRLAVRQFGNSVGLLESTSDRGIVFAYDVAERWEPDAALAAALERVLSLAVVGRNSAGVGARLAWAQRYTYDRNGNRLTKATGYGTIEYRYGPEDELQRASRAIYSYDADGRMVKSIGQASTTVSRMLVNRRATRVRLNDTPRIAAQSAIRAQPTRSPRTSALAAFVTLRAYPARACTRSRSAPAARSA